MTDKEKARREAQSVQAKAPKEPQPVTLKASKQQIDGLKARWTALLDAQKTLNEFASAIVAGHGYDKAQLQQYDDVKNTVTILPLP
jgi:hypothetical protein